MCTSHSRKRLYSSGAKNVLRPLKNVRQMTLATAERSWRAKNVLALDAFTWVQFGTYPLERSLHVKNVLGPMKNVLEGLFCHLQNALQVHSWTWRSFLANLECISRTFLRCTLGLTSQLKSVGSASLHLKGRSCLLFSQTCKSMWSASWALRDLLLVPPLLPKLLFGYT